MKRYVDILPLPSKQDVCLLVLMHLMYQQRQMGKTYKDYARLLLQVYKTIWPIHILHILGLHLNQYIQ
jgi:hypothetical protein